MMASKNDVPGARYLRPSQIGPLEAAGASRVMLEEEKPGKFTALICFMRREAASHQFIAFRCETVPLNEMSESQLERFLAHACRRVADHHASLPLTDEEQAAADAAQGLS